MVKSISNQIKNKTFILTCIGFVSILILFISLILWSHRVHVASESSANSICEFYLKEISDRYVTSVSSELVKRRNTLTYTLDELKPGIVKNEDTISEYIRFAKRMNNLDIFYLIDDKGTIYSSSGIIEDIAGLDFITEPITRIKNIVIENSDKKMMMVLLVPCNVKNPQGINIVSSVSGIVVESIVSQNQFSKNKQESFCEIYQNNGIPIVETDENPLDATDLFTYFENNAIFAQNYSLEKLRTDWSENKCGFTVYEIENFGKTYLYYDSIPQTNWMIATILRENDIDEVVEKGSQKISLYSLIVVIVVIVVMLGLFLIIIRILKREKKTQIEKEIEQNANKAKTTFLFNMSHDIRTPMNAIIGYTNLTEKNIDDKPKALDYLHKIKLSGDLLLSIINNVLEIAKIESGTEKLNEVPWEMGGISDSIVSVFDNQVTNKKIEFVKEVDVKHKNLICDSVKVREIYLNLISNAYKYTPDGGKITMSLREIPCEKPGYVTIKTVITDTGIGMSPEYLPHVFEEFSRERTSTESKVTGTGLGMQIVKKYIDLMGGTIDIESEAGKGTKITFTLTHKIWDKEVDSADQKSKSEYENVDFTGMHILLAEDNDLNAEIAETVLQELGFFVDRVEDGYLCVEMLKRASEDDYNLILMDIQMPKLSGYEATKVIRKLENSKKASIPILAMTANAFEEDKQEAAQAGMNGHISKPFSIDDLKSALAHVLA